jgi:hypothetical protein
VAKNDGWTKVYLNGKLVARGSGQTEAGALITNMRYGFADCSGQKSPLSVYMRNIQLERAIQVSALQ